MLTNLIEWNDDVENHCPEVVKYLVGNKVDLTNEIKVSKGEGNRYKDIINVADFIETSAKTSENVEAVFTELTRLILNIATESSCSPASPQTYI